MKITYNRAFVIGLIVYSVLITIIALYYIYMWQHCSVAKFEPAPFWLP